MATTDKFTLIYLVSDIQAAVRRNIEAIALDLTHRSRRRAPPEAYRHLQVILPLVELTLEKVAKRAAADQLDPLTCHKVITAIEACRHKVDELSDTLRRARPGGTRDRLRRVFRPKLKVTWETKIRGIADEVVECDVQVAQAGDIGPDEEEVTSIVFDKEVKMDAHFDDIVRRMVWISNKACSNWNTY